MDELETLVLVLEHLCLITMSLAFFNLVPPGFAFLLSLVGTLSLGVDVIDFIIEVENWNLLAIN